MWNYKRGLHVLYFLLLAFAVVTGIWSSMGSSMGFVYVAGCFAGMGVIALALIGVCNMVYPND